MFKFKIIINASVVFAILLGVALSNILIKIGGVALFVFFQLELMPHYYFLRILQLFPFLIGLSFVFVDFSKIQNSIKILRPILVAISFLIAVSIIETTDHKLFAPISSVGYKIENYTALKELQLFNKSPKIAVLGPNKIYFLKSYESEIQNLMEDRERENGVTH